MSSRARRRAGPTDDECAWRNAGLRSRCHPDDGAHRHQLAPGRLCRAGRLPGAAPDPRGEDAAGGGHCRGQEVGLARPWRCRLPDRSQVELHAAAIHGREIRGLQLRRGRAGHLQGPRHPALQPARADRGHGDRRLRDGLQARIQLRSRRDLGNLRTVRGGAGRGLRGRLSRQRHPGLGLFVPPAEPPWLWRVHLRRGDGAARIARGQEGPAPVQAAVPGELRPVWQADDDQQHGDLRRGALDHAPRRRGVPRSREAEQRWHQDLLGVGRRKASGQLRGAARHSFRDAAGDGGRGARGPHAEGRDSRRLVDARAPWRGHARHRHGLRFDRQGRLDAGLGRGDRDGRLRAAW